MRLLLLVILLLGGGLAWQWFDENAVPRSLAWTPPAAVLPELAKPVPAPLSGASAANPAQYLAMLERPLFAPDRRPPPPPAPPALPAPPPAPPPPDPLGNVQISGIFSGDPAGIIANVDGKARRVRINDSIGGWTLKSISGREVTFGQGSDSRQLRMNYSRLGPPVVRATAPNMVPAAPGQAPPATTSTAQNSQDEGRERLRRRNEIRAARGLPLITE